MNYVYLCDELAVGPKTTDHTISFLQHYIDTHIDSWVRNLTFCLDNARICKNKYLLAWATELVDSGKYDSIRFIYMVVGHTKFEPDQLFASITMTFYDRDVFTIEMLQSIAQLYSTSYIFKSDQIMQWRSSIEDKYSALPGITSRHDFIITRKTGTPEIQVRDTCFLGLYNTVSLRKPNSLNKILSPISHSLSAHKLSEQKLQHLTEQHDRYIKASVDGYVRPSFLLTPEGGLPSQTTQKKHGCSLCDGKGHVHPGKKRHYSEKYCPVAAKQTKNH